jgi:hypothetical protein
VEDARLDGRGTLSGCLCVQISFIYVAERFGDYALRGIDRVLQGRSLD